MRERFLIMTFEPHRLALLPEEFAGSGGPIEGFPSDFVTTALQAAAMRLNIHVAFGARVRSSAEEEALFNDLGVLVYTIHL